MLYTFATHLHFLSFPPIFTIAFYVMYEPRVWAQSFCISTFNCRATITARLWWSGINKSERSTSDSIQVVTNLFQSYIRQNLGRLDPTCSLFTSSGVWGLYSRLTLRRTLRGDTFERNRWNRLRWMPPKPWQNQHRRCSRGSNSPYTPGESLFCTSITVCCRNLCKDCDI